MKLYIKTIFNKYLRFTLLLILSTVIRKNLFYISNLIIVYSEKTMFHHFPFGHIDYGM